MRIGFQLKYFQLFSEIDHIKILLRMRLFGAFVGFAAAQTTETPDWYTDWFNTAYDWAGIVSDYYTTG